MSCGSVEFSSIELPINLNAVVQAPTGSGKTTAAFREIASVLERGMKAVYLCPLRALARETYDRFQEDSRFGKVGLFTGETGGNEPEVAFADADFLILTPERFDACTRAWRAHWGWIPQVDLVVVDELHLLGDARRGGRLEGGVARFRRLNPFSRIIGLSATLGNRAEVANWLQASQVVSDHRPIPLSWRVVRYEDPQDKAELAKDEVARCVAAGGQNLVFVQSRRRAEALAEYFRQAGLRAAHHHGGLGTGRRGTVELQCRSGELDVVVATATLEMGLNLPVRQVLLYDLQRFDGLAMTPIDVTSVWQRAGRAGRPGLDTRGEVVLLAHRRDKFAENYESGQFEPLRSALLKDSVLAEQIIADIASGVARTSPQVHRAIQTTYGGSTSTLPVARVLGEMMSAGMVVYSDDADAPGRKLKATKLGKVVSRHMLSPRTVVVLKSIFDSTTEPSMLQLMFELCSCAECEPHLFVDYEELEQLQPLLSKIGDGLSEEPQVCAKRLSTTGRGLVSATKKAALLMAWTQLGSMDEACERHGCYPFEGERLQESMVRLLQAVGDLAGILEDEAKDKWVTRTRCLATMVLGGMNHEAATLSLVDGIGAKTASKLVQSGIKDIEDLALAEPLEVAAAVGGSQKRAQKWIDQAAELVKTHGAYFFREQGANSACEKKAKFEAKVDPYRLRRAMSLRVAVETTGKWVVSGGSENRRVVRSKGELKCDCPDHAKGNECKHIMAVRLKQRDAELKGLVNRFSSSSDEWNVYRLWMDKDPLEMIR